MTEPTQCFQNVFKSLMQHLKCTICLDILKEPVTATCGHTFCMNCLSGNSCPLCRSHLPELKLNFILNEVLKDLLEPQTPSPDEFTAQPGEVLCNVCIEGPKYKAVKTCLICLSSFCKKHLNKYHELYFKGHHLIEPVNDIEKWACSVHGRPLELYSVSEMKLVCSLCVQKGTNLVPVKEEADNKKAEIDRIVSEAELRFQKRKDNLKELDISAANCLDPINEEIAKIQQVFNAINTTVKKAEDEALKPLEERKRQVQQQSEDLKKGLQEIITKLSKTISDLQKVKDEKDPLSFIQSCPPITTADVDDNWTSLSLDSEISCGTLKNIELAMMTNIKTELMKLARVEVARIKKFGVDVNLDPDTANAQLQISDDMRQVQNSVKTQNVSDHPERFDMFGCILGQNRLTDSRAFWVVEIGNKKGWDIGVASEEANRKGKLSLKPSQGYWTIVHYNGDKYAALEDTPILLSPLNAPCKVGVFVDYSEKLVSFYDMEAETHIYSFTNCAFGKVIRPYFSPHNSQEDPLIIWPVDKIKK